MTKGTRSMFEHIISLNAMQVMTLTQQTKDIRALLDSEDKERVVNEYHCVVLNCSVCATLKRSE